ncbi:DUF695 domain-containing protein [Nibribacter ruber]|uniref:DUF695 domain-containing protein n=1 Tax=Nibribacter ruber TaxID=2698458 RepID=A0A6P1NTS6_9BACT|nr:DUF695 domain-containing protein [Nibribacter ruber]QHL87276.1 DUF695 domain-containing protein [Nibribacter ruber]
MAQAFTPAYLKALITEEDVWSIAEGENNGTPFSVRFRPHLQPFLETGRYAKRLIILWNYTSEDEYLFPTPEDMDVMADVEETLVDHLEADAQSVLTFVFTGQERREWHWYTSDMASAQERLNEALSHFDRLPIELTAEDDADWAEYLSILENMEEAEEEDSEEDL